MTDRTELLEAALDSRPDGIALFNMEGVVVFWNQAAQCMIGYTAIELLSRPLPPSLAPLLLTDGAQGETIPAAGSKSGHRALARVCHKLGHTVSVFVRVAVLRNGLGERIGSAVIFHPAENLDAPPNNEENEDRGVEESRVEFEERLQTEYEDFQRGGPPFGVIRVSIDQAETLRKTHGVAAHHTMIEKIRRALAQGLRPAEEMGRWHEDEFLILAHERSTEMLIARARTLAGLARTADFRWWGDRVSLTASIGAAQATSGSSGGATETLTQLLERTRKAMETSSREGGNCATAAVYSPATSATEDL
jgi:PAS domain S-box-containing protein/diguanylate cyclase (GGDEF)-like protein